MRRLFLAAALAALAPACILVVDADVDSDWEGLSLQTLSHPGFQALVEDLEERGWEVEGLKPRGEHLRWEVESDDGREATLLVRLGPGHGYTIDQVRTDDGEAAPDLEELRP